MRTKPPSEATLGRGNPRVNRSFNCGLPYKSELQPQFQVRRPFRCSPRYSLCPSAGAVYISALPEPAS